MLMRSDLMTHRHKSPLLITSFFCPIDLVVNTKLPVLCKLQNRPSDSINIDSHCGCRGSSNVEEAVLQVLESSIGWMFDQLHWSRHPAGGVSIYLLEEY